jgi:hypothetical protein
MICREVTIYISKIRLCDITYVDMEHWDARLTSYAYFGHKYIKDRNTNRVHPKLMRLCPILNSWKNYNVLCIAWPYIPNYHKC